MYFEFLGPAFRKMSGFPLCCDALASVVVYRVIAGRFGSWGMVGHQKVIKWRDTAKVASKFLRNKIKWAYNVYICCSTFKVCISDTGHTWNMFCSFELLSTIVACPGRLNDFLEGGQVPNSEASTSNTLLTLQCDCLVISRTCFILRKQFLSGSLGRSVEAGSGRGRIDLKKCLKMQSKRSKERIRSAKFSKQEATEATNIMCSTGRPHVGHGIRATNP